MEDKLPFKVLEFNGEARRIVLSHTRTFEEGDDVVEAAPAKRGARKGGDDGHGQSPSVRSVNEKVEKSTLGDLGVLSDLKNAMENTERGGKAPKRKARRVEEDDADFEDMEG